MWLGVDAIWITPFYPSPMADFGYDVADYCGIDPLFGTMQGFDHLLAEFTNGASNSSWTWFPTILPTSIPGFSRAALLVTIPNEIGTCGETNQTIGRAISADLAGSGMNLPASTTYHSFLKQQPD